MNFSNFAAAGCAVALAGALAGCGGGDDGAVAETTRGTPAAVEPTRGYEAGPLKVPARGPAEYRIRGYREDVPAFGREASREELAQAASYAHGYGIGRLEENWPRACRFASESLVRRLAAKAGLPRSASCEEALETVPDIVLGSEYERTEVEANSLRVDGRRGYLLYSGATAPYFMPVIEEDRVWKVDSRAPTPFYYSENK